MRTVRPMRIKSHQTGSVAVRTGLKFDGLLALVKEYIVDVWEIRKHKLYDSDSGSVCNSILSLQLGRGMVSSFRMVSLVRMVSLARMVSSSRMVCLVRKVRCI